MITNMHFLRTKLPIYFIVLFILIAGVMTSPTVFAGPSPSSHGTIVVNSNSDSSTPSDGLCSLREAIANANNRGVNDTTGSDCALGGTVDTTITFSAPMTITPSNYYTISAPIILDATTVSGTSCTSKTLSVVINGAGTGSDIFQIGSGTDGSVIKGFVLQYANNYAINATNSSNIAISCNIIGLNQAGTLAAANHNGGIQINNSTNDTIGGTNPGDGNVISGNTMNGIQGSKTKGLTIEANLIGTALDGATIISNGGFGLDMGNGDTDLMIGGISRALGNIVMGNNTYNNIWLDSTVAQSTNVSVLNNTFAAYGEPVEFDNVKGLIVQGNYFGLDSTGTTLIPDTSFSSLSISNDFNATIGGTDPSARNYLVSSSTGGQSHNIIQARGPFVNSVIEGNYIGLNVNGIVPAGQMDNGIILSNNVDGLIVGGTAPGAGNVIAGGTRNGPVNTGAGININFNSSHAHILGNLIGTDPSGHIHSGYGNTAGIFSIGNVPGAQIGGTAPGEGNIIAGNDIGVGVLGFTGTLGNVSILGNSIFGNTAYLHYGDGIDNLGIDGSFSTILRYGPTPNTIGNTNFTTDGFLNYPELSPFTSSGSTISIPYTLDVPAGNYRVEFFKNPTLGGSTSGYGEGEVFIGADTFTSTGSPKTQTFTVTGASTDVVTATATQDFGAGSYGATSEFSNAVTILNPAPAGGSGGVTLLFGCKDPGAVNYNSNIAITNDSSQCVYKKQTVPPTSPVTISTSTPVSSTSTPATYTFTHILKPYITDEEVLHLQAFLNSHGYPVALTGPGSLGKEITTFGKATQKALANYQKANNILPSSGLFGPKTLKYINTLVTVGK